MKDQTLTYVMREINPELDQFQQQLWDSALWIEKNLCDTCHPERFALEELSTCLRQFQAFTNKHVERLLTKFEHMKKIEE